jgi:hypothetical protein
MTTPFVCPTLASRSQTGISESRETTSENYGLLRARRPVDFRPKDVFTAQRRSFYGSPSAASLMYPAALADSMDRREEV